MVTCNSVLEPILRMARLRELPLFGGQILVGIGNYFIKSLKSCQSGRNFGSARDFFQASFLNLQAHNIKQLQEFLAVGQR